ncbi:hypothetical protein E4T42_04634 [Aureobasidium subglaciale]|nr:hypothetical protein E4T42_04634 [Aureobasidium subglaciale]
MLAGYETSAREHVFRSLFKRASDSFDSEDFEESERLCRLLLNYADLSIYHQAGCHRILSLGDENFLWADASANHNQSWHAEQAVNLYEQLFYPDGEALADHLLSDVQVRKRNDILQHAYSNLAQAERDHVEIRCDYMERYDRFKAIFGCTPAKSDVSEICLYRHSQSYRLAIDGNLESYGLFIERVFRMRGEKWDLICLAYIAKGLLNVEWDQATPPLEPTISANCIMVHHDNMNVLLTDAPYMLPGFCDPYLEASLDAIAGLTKEYHDYVKAGPQLSMKSDPTPIDDLESKVLEEESMHRLKESMVEKDKMMNEMLEEAVRDVHIFVGSGIQAIEGPPEDMGRAEVSVAFAKTNLASLPEDLRHP